MKRLNCLTMYAIAAIVLFCGGFANAVELGDPNVTVTDGNVSITNTGGAFISRLDVNSPTALTGSTPIRMTVGHSGARFFMQAYGSGAAGNLQNAATLGAVASRLLIGADAGASVMFYSNGQFATGPGHLFIQGTPGATMGFVGIGNNAPTTKLDVTGEVKMTVANITGGSDLAEKFEVRTVANTKIEPGMVVCIDPDKPGQLMLSSKPYDKTVAGIISGAGGLNTGMLMGQQNSLADGAHPVALSGRVYCMVDTEADGIVPGDMLTTSSLPGHAMKMTDHALAVGSVIGKAMTPLAKGEKGLVMVLVSLQ